MAPYIVYADQKYTKETRGPKSINLFFSFVFDEENQKHAQRHYITNAIFDIKGGIKKNYRLYRQKSSSSFILYRSVSKSPVRLLYFKDPFPKIQSGFYIIQIHFQKSSPSFIL
jgi:hypothetical protein